MAKFLGEFKVSNEEHEIFKHFNEKDYAMYFIEKYGQIDGAHHKVWVLDQVARILKGTKVTIKEARWDDGTVEFRLSCDYPSNEYLVWVESMKGPLNEDGEYEYDYDTGIDP